MSILTLKMFFFLVINAIQQLAKQSMSFIE